MKIKNSKITIVVFQQQNTQDVMDKYKHMNRHHTAEVLQLNPLLREHCLIQQRFSIVR